jgi:LysR family transcriptional regulator, regulator for bpeEF and oprC
MDRIEAMRAFVRVVDDGTFTKAAERMELGAPTVTRLVQMLEEHLQTKLLNRTTRRVTLTAEGAIYYERAVRLLNEFQELESDMTRAKAKPHGRLRIDVGASVGQMLLIPALPDFLAKYPDIQIDLGLSDRPVDIMSESVDCALRGGTIADESLVARKIGELPSLVCASPSYLAQRGAPVHPRDLESDAHLVVNYISHGSGQPFPFSLSKDDEEFEIQGRHALSVDDANAALAAGLAGIGIVGLPTFMCQEAVESKRLLPVMMDWKMKTIPLHVVYTPNRHLSTKVRVFVDWAAELFSKKEDKLIAMIANRTDPSSSRELERLARRGLVRPAATVR